MERILDEISYEAPDPKWKKVTVDEALVRTKLEAVMKDEDLSRFIL